MATPSTPVDLSPFYGTYRGISPTDESSIGYGELEVIIDENGLKSRMATGLKILSEEVPVSALRPLTLEELRADYVEGSVPLEKMIGFKVEDGVRLLFMQEEGDADYGLLVRGNEMADLLGPTFGFSPKQVDAGKYQAMLDSMRAEEGENCLPLLAKGGKC